MYLIALPEMVEDSLDPCSYCTGMASGHLSLQQQHLGHFGGCCQVALALVLVALTRPLLATRSQLCCCSTDTHGLHCTRNYSHPAHCKCPRISRAHQCKPWQIGMQCGMRWGWLHCASGALQGGAAHPAPGWPCLLCHSRPRAAPTHLRAAAIRLNVAIWTNMDPSEGGRKSCP